MIRLKQLPKKTDLKNFYNLNDYKNFIVKNIEYSKDRIIMSCSVKDDKKHVYIPFYQDINFVDFNKKTFLISIESKYFQHVIKNVSENLDYIKNQKIINKKP